MTGFAILWSHSNATYGMSCSSWRLFAARDCAKMCKQCENIIISSIRIGISPSGTLLLEHGDLVRTPGGRSPVQASCRLAGHRLVGLGAHLPLYLYQLGGGEASRLSGGALAGGTELLARPHPPRCPARGAVLPRRDPLRPRPRARLSHGRRRRPLPLA